MTNVISRAGQSIADALTASLPDLRVTTSIGRSVPPPAVIIAPPRLMWHGFTNDGLPKTAQWNVYLTYELNEYAAEVLIDLVPAVAAAIDKGTLAAVLSAAPVLYHGPDGPVPAYQFTVQMELSAF